MLSRIARHVCQKAARPYCEKNCFITINVAVRQFHLLHRSPRIMPVELNTRTFIGTRNLFRKDAGKATSQYDEEEVKTNASHSKKTRMDQLQPSADVIKISSTDFKEIATKFPNMLVDKTELIKIFCTKGNQHEFITAPPRFGKTVNLTMFRCFFKIEVDPLTGTLKTQLDPKTEAITDTENYRLFANLKLAIMDHPDIVKKHFGRHPVLYVSFKCGKSIATVDDAMKFCRTVVHDAFNQHAYLRVSEKLDDEQKTFCKRWCSPNTYKKMDPDDALKHLAEFLYQHFQRDVVFLVDEYDSLVARALVEVVKHDKIVTICKKPVDMICDLLKTSDENIRLLGSLVTGVSYIAGIGWSGVANNITPCRFTQHHLFNKFYGFQKEEIEGLLGKLGNFSDFKVKQEALSIMKAQYNGYEYPDSKVNTGQEVYCPWSVMNYLREGSPQSFWAHSAYTEPLQNMFQNDHVRNFLSKLLEGNGTQQLDIVAKLEARHLVELKNYMRGIPTETDKSDVLFLNFILELGYLTLDCTRPKTKTYHYVKVPNTEVKVMILEKLRNYYKKKCSTEFKQNASIKSVQILNSIKSAADPNVSDEVFMQAVRVFREELQHLFQLYSRDCLVEVNESGLHCFMAEIITTGNFTYLTEHYVPDSKGRLDVLGFDEQFAFLLELKNYATTKKCAVDALNQILEKEYFRAFEQPVLSNPKCHVLMGISVNGDKMAVSAIRNHNKETNAPKFTIGFYA